MRSLKGQINLTALPVVFLIFMVTLFVFFRLSVRSSFILIIGSLIFITAFIKTDLALIFLIFSMLFSPEFSVGSRMVGGRTVDIRADDLFLIVVFLGWFAKMAINKELGLLRTTPLNRPILVYFSFCILTSVLAIMRGFLDVKASFFYNLKYAEYFLLFFLVANNLRNLRQAKVFVFFLLLTYFLVCLYVLVSLPQRPERVTAPFEGRAGEANTLAGYLILMMAIILGFILYAKTLKLRLILLGLLAIAIPPFAMTLSRSGWISFFCMYISLIILTKRAKVTLVFILLMLIVILPFVVPERVKQRIQETFPQKGWAEYNVLGKKISVDESTYMRIYSWKYAYDRWLERPVVGYGVPAGIVTDNHYARVLREVGSFGFIAFIWLLFKIFKTARSTYLNSEGNNFAQGLSLGFSAGFFGLLSQATTQETFILIRIMEPFWFFCAIIVLLLSLTTAETEK